MVSELKYTFRPHPYHFVVSKKTNQRTFHVHLKMTYSKSCKRLCEGE